MSIARRCGFGLLVAIAATSPAWADGVTYETDANGVTYQVTRRTSEVLLPKTEYQTRQETVYQPRVTTQYQTTQQEAMVPVTEYRVVSQLEGRWNPFIQPYWSHRVAPVTRWERKPVTVQTPITKTEWVAQQREVRTPVTTYQKVTNTSVNHVAVTAPTTRATAGAWVAASPNSVATAPIAAGAQMQNDPPRMAPQIATNPGAILR